MELIKEWWKIAVVRHVVISLIVILAAVILYLIIKKIWREFRKRGIKDGTTRVQNTMHYVVYDTIKVGVFLFLVLAILQINGVNVTSLIAGVGVASAVIGLALQDFLKDIIMGVHILMDDFFQIGDLVQFAEDEGIVEDFNLRTTKVRSIRTGDLYTVCNRNIDHMIRSGKEIYIHALLPYDTPAGRAVEVMHIITERISKNEGVESCDFLGLSELGSSGVDYLIRLFLEDPRKKLGIRRDALAVIRDVLAEENIVIPYNQLDVHMKEDGNGNM